MAETDEPILIPIPTLHCLKCGYNLTGLPAGSCPECKTTFDPAKLHERSQWRRPHFFQGVLMVLIVPGASILVWPLGMALQNVVSMGSGILLAVMASLLAVGIAITTSIIAGRRLARRLARKYPSDPPTPATVGMTILFALMFFSCQTVLVPFFIGIGVACTSWMFPDR